MTTWVCADGTPDEDHNWEYLSDWYGDPGVINGTCTFYFKRCRECGKEDDWDGSDFARDEDIEGAEK